MNEDELYALIQNEKIIDLLQQTSARIELYRGTPIDDSKKLRHDKLSVLSALSSYIFILKEKERIQQNLTFREYNLINPIQSTKILRALTGSIQYGARF